MSAPHIVKADGSTEQFNEDRLRQSLIRAGATETIAKRIAETIAMSVVPGAASREIYRRAFSLLRKEGRSIAARYSLRRAMLELGPTGHPFEDFISHLYTVEGWSVETRKMIKGHCVTHEVDFYASHPAQNEHMAAELKYHNDPGYKTDLKVALYVKSRFDDIFACDESVRSCPIDRGILVTNTKFTTEAIAYASCAGVELLGWGYPDKGNLLERMTKSRVYPVTTLTTLTRSGKNHLIEKGVVTIDELLENRAILGELHLDSELIGSVISECKELIELPLPQYATL